MMHALQNRKAGLKRAQGRFTGALRRSQTAVSPHLVDSQEESERYARGGAERIGGGDGQRILGAGESLSERTRGCDF